MWLNLRDVTLFILGTSLLRGAHAKWVEGHIDTKENWAFLARFCFLSLEGQFEYLIEFDRDMGTPDLLLYYDDDSQWPAVYHSSKTCSDREAVLNKAGQNQIIRLSHWYPDTELSGCVVTKENKELPASKSPPSTTPKPVKTTKSFKKMPNSTEIESPRNTSYYDQFLKTTPSSKPSNSSSDDVTTWYEISATDENVTTTEMPDGELWETIAPNNGSRFENLKDVEMLFDRGPNGKRMKRSIELYERFRRRRLNGEGNLSAHPSRRSVNTERLVVTCHNTRRFRSARERWWFIAISNCGSSEGLDVKYRFLMTNGPDGDFWHEHFSADEFYVLPVLLAYTFAYVIVMIAVVMCSVELKSRHLLHSTYKLFLGSTVSQHVGVILQSLAYIRYAADGVGSESTKIIGQFFCGTSEMTFLLLLVLMAKGYTITRGRLKVAFTVKLTVFMCCYIVTYIVLFIYKEKAFDPGEVLYLYESPAGYGIIVLRMAAWCMFAYSTFFTVRKYPEKNTFYCPFFISGTLWFHAGPLFILTANSYIDKWVRESVVTAVLLLITFCGHITFLLLTLPVFANKNFPYHVRTTQIGIMEVTGNAGLDSFGHNAYHPQNGGAQTVIIPLTRRTEELIGNMYNQYMATAPPLSLEHDSRLNIPKRINSLSPKNVIVKQDSTDTNNSDDIIPHVAKNEPGIFTVESQMSKIENEQSMLPTSKPNSPNNNSNSPAKLVLPAPENGNLPKSEKLVENGINGTRSELPSVLRSRRNILDPIKRDNIPTWSLAKGPSVIAMQKKVQINGSDSPEKQTNGVLPLITKKVPPVKNGLPSSGEISTIHEGYIPSFQNSVSKATIDLFSVGSNKG